MPISESAVRGRLRRRGYALQKSRTRNENDPTFGMYRIVDPFTNTVVEGCATFWFELDLDEAIDISRNLEKNWRM